MNEIIGIIKNDASISTNIQENLILMIKNAQFLNRKVVTLEQKIKDIDASLKDIDAYKKR